MTLRATSDYSQISVFVPSELDQRIRDAADRSGETRGEWLLSRLKRAVEQDENNPLEGIE